MTADAAPPRLLAISDLHVRYPANRDAVAALEGDYARDWLILAGDAGERVEHLEFALDALTPRFARVIWTPGNHDLWCPPGATDRTRGVARYEELVAICRARGVTTPEDPYLAWPGDPGTFIAPMFLLYDYSFRPADVSRADALEWAAASGVLCRDEAWLDATPWPTREAWCEARCALTAARLDALPATARTILVNHWPLRYDLARPPRIPRFSLWCGTSITEDWAIRYRARAVISGHLHFRTSLVRHGVRYDEVSLGYPRDWRVERGVAWYLREILSGETAGPARFEPPRDPFLPSAIRAERI
jgi:3',5'-cyclic AMP phosphodiesterase CpdA